MKVTLREKKLKNGMLSLYLDFYPAIQHPDTKKETRREFLGLYLYVKPKTEIEKSFNKETKMQAETVKANRQISLQSNKFGFLRKEKHDVDFVEYFRTLTQKKYSSKSNYDTWVSALNYIEKFTGGSYMFSQVTEQFCNEYRNFLLTTKSFRSKKSTLSQNAASTYFNKFKAALHQAYRDELIDNDIATRINYIKTEETTKGFLSLEEVKKLIATDCDYTLLKTAALFSALTGLRISDLKKLEWSDIFKNEDGHYINYTQQKTKSKQSHKISLEALELLEKKDESNLVFPGLNNSASDNAHLKKWLYSAEIYRSITFHSFRHTYATLLIASGIDIYIVSNMMGHKNVKTTQVYAKVIDKLKIEAANSITLK